MNRYRFNFYSSFSMVITGEKFEFNNIILLVKEVIVLIYVSLFFESIFL